MAHPLVAVDPAALVVARLAASPDLTTALGGSGRVGGKNVPPYPCVVVTDTGGDDGIFRWLTTYTVQVEAFGDPDGRPGKFALRRVLYLALTHLGEWPDATYVTGSPVVTNVRSASGGAWAPLPTGQPRYVAAVTIHAHPAKNPTP